MQFQLYPYLWTYYKLIIITTNIIKISMGWDETLSISPFFGYLLGRLNHQFFSSLLSQFSLPSFYFDLLSFSIPSLAPSTNSDYQRNNKRKISKIYRPWASRIITCGFHSFKQPLSLFVSGRRARAPSFLTQFM